MAYTSAVADSVFESLLQGEPEQRIVSVRVVSDDDLFRLGCERVLAGDERLRLGGFSAGLGGQSVLEIVHGTIADVLLVGTTDIDEATVDLAKLYIEARPSAPIAIVFGRATARSIGELAEISQQSQGGFACVSRESVAVARDLRRLVWNVAAGQSMFDQKALRALAERPSGLTERLSRREREVLALIADGLSNNEIADALFLERKTIERHISGIYAKLGSDSQHGHARVRTVLTFLRATGRLDIAY